MRAAPEFWWREGRDARALALWPLARMWGAGAAWRMARPPRFRPPVPVICVGNFVVGGAGKTPTAIALARVARGRGLRPGILSGGYGGRLRGPVLIDTDRHTAADVGDEAMLLARAAPTVVAADRAAGARLLLGEGATVIVLDDGFQDPTLAKDVVLVAIDGGGGVGNGKVLPAGPLRAPLDLQLRRADALLLVGEGAPGEHVSSIAARAGRQVMRARLKPATVREWRGQPTLAFAGIGRPAKFFETLRDTRVDLAETRAFPDHHPYTDADAAELMEAAAEGGMRLVTTEKDMMRLAAATSEKVRQLREAATAFAVTLRFDNPTAAEDLVDEAVRRSTDPERAQIEPNDR